MKVSCRLKHPVRNTNNDYLNNPLKAYQKNNSNSQPKSNKLKIKFILLILLFCSCKNYTFEGNVHDYDTDKPLKNVEIIINNTITRTDSLGFFSLKINSNAAEIILKKNGYATKKVHRESNTKEEKHNENLKNSVIYLYKRESDFIPK
jgi:hypothetical protein